jgi:uncharacterized RDD family membrane protein YckC
MDSANPYASPRSDVNAEVEGPQMPPAGRGVRFGARLIDGLLEGGPYIIGAMVMGAMTRPDAPVFWPVLLGGLFSFVVWLYQTIRLVQTGQTLGKKWLDIKVVRRDGGAVSFGGHFVRGLIYNFGGLISVLFIFRADRRTLHDMAGETKVVVV